MGFGWRFDYLASTGVKSSIAVAGAVYRVGRGQESRRRVPTAVDIIMWFNDK